MEVISSYKVKILHYNHIFDETIAVYRKAIAFFIDVCNQEWKSISDLKGNNRNNYVETLTIQTKNNPFPKYDFNKCTYKMPSYLRRAAIQEAIGCYSSYVSNHESWIRNGRTGREPKLTLVRNTMPTLYKPNMFIMKDRNSARIKVFHKNDWVWLDIGLRNQDIKYLDRHCKEDTLLSPKLKRQGRFWHLSFPVSRKIDLHKTDILEQHICAIDLGLNNNAVCSIMQSDGTVVARKFINLAAEKDHLHKALGRQKKAQQHGNRKTPVLWKHVNDINTDISRKTAKEILDFAILYNVDTIVFEHLDSKGKKHGHRKQRLALWRKNEIQRIVEHNAHKNGMRISRICAWNTSKLAFDGSGKVERGSYEQDGEVKYNYSICIFPNGKTYHCDLNASYNIGARYFIRELLKSESVMTRLPTGTNVSLYGTGTTRTLSTLIRLNADLCAICA